MTFSRKDTRSASCAWPSSAETPSVALLVPSGVTTALASRAILAKAPALSVTLSKTPAVAEFASLSAAAVAHFFRSSTVGFSRGSGRRELASFSSETAYSLTFAKAASYSGLTKDADDACRTPDTPPFPPLWRSRAAADKAMLHTTRRVRIIKGGSDSVPCVLR